MLKWQSLPQMMVKKYLTATCKRIKVEHCLGPYIKINSKWIRLQAIIFLKDNIGSLLFDTVLGVGSNRKSQPTLWKHNKWLHQTETLLHCQRNKCRLISKAAEGDMKCIYIRFSRNTCNWTMCSLGKCIYVKCARYNKHSFWNIRVIVKNTHKVK